MSTILITHDLGLAAAYCDRVVVMEKGGVVETAKSARYLPRAGARLYPKLMRATPRPGVTLRDLLPEEEGARSAGDTGRQRRDACGNDVSKAAARSSRSSSRNIRARAPPPSLGKLFRRKPPVEAEHVPRGRRHQLPVGHGESVGLVGESGCGKSTTSMMVMRLLDQTSGRIVFDGEDIGAIPPKSFARLPLRKRIQMVFQDPTDSLNPRFTAARAIADPILQLGDIRGRDALRARCEELAGQVGLPLELLDRFPHQLSGGQKARVGIARAIALHPDLVILDEPTAALDVSVQAVVLNLLQDLKQRSA